MTPQDVVKIYPSRRALGKLIGTTGACISMWILRDHVPTIAQLQLNHLSAGKLRVSPEAKAELKRMALGHLVL